MVLLRLLAVKPAAEKKTLTEARRPAPSAPAALAAPAPARTAVPVPPVPERPTNPEAQQKPVAVNAPPGQQLPVVDPRAQPHPRPAVPTRPAQVVGVPVRVQAE